MDIATLIEPALSFVREILEGRAGNIARYSIAGTAFVVLALGVRRLSVELRTWSLIGISLGILTFLTTVEIAGVFVLYLIVLYLAAESLPSGHARTAVLVGLIAVHAVGPILWLPLLPGYEGQAREFVAFASNLTLVRAWGYAYDRSRRREPTPPRFADYALYMLFFPTLVNGPIVTHLEFQQRKLGWYWAEGERPTLLAALSAERVAIRRALVGIALGLFTMGVLFDRHAAMNQIAIAGGTSTWPNALLTYFWWYLTFTAWTEAAIGFSRLSGIRMPENFDAPHFAYGPADFWRRWNITFMRWLRRYVYLPLGGAFVRGFDGERHLEWRNTAAVFGVVAGYHLLGGLKLLGPHWYGTWSWVPWTLWAVINTIAVLATRNLKRPDRIGPLAIVVIISTLLFSSFGHMTAQFPPNAPLSSMLTLFRGLIWPL